MNASIQYYDLTGEFSILDPNIFQAQNTTVGHIPGLTWQDSNENLYRAIVVETDFAKFIYKDINFKYEIHIKPTGVDEWLLKKRCTEPINQSNVIETSSGYMVNLSLIINEDGTLPEGFWETHTPQYDYFSMLVQKNVFNLPVALDTMMLKRIETLENLTITV